MRMASAAGLVTSDPYSAYVLAYDAARFACIALLAQQGLRATTSGGHYAVEQAVRAQFGDGFRPFGILQRRRNELEYPHLSVLLIIISDRLPSTLPRSLKNGASHPGRQRPLAGGEGHTSPRSPPAAAGSQLVSRQLAGLARRRAPGVAAVMRLQPHPQVLPARCALIGREVSSG